MQRVKDFGKKELAIDVLYDILGTAMMAVGITCFSAANNIAPGGVTGLSVMSNYLTGVPISVFTLLYNIPLLILAWIFLGRSFSLKTIKSVFILSVMLQIASMYLPVYKGNMLLAALYGGVIDGIGIALILMRSSTTGGTDIASRLLQLKFPHMPVGRLILFVDAFVLATSAFVYQNIENALYGMIAIFATTSVIDSLIYGVDKGKMMMIMTQKPEEISAAIIERLKRSTTFLDGKGGYSKRAQPVLLCVVRKTQYFELKRIVHSVDPHAFMMAMETSEIIGEGFKDIEKSTKAN